MKLISNTQLLKYSSNLKKEAGQVLESLSLFKQLSALGTVYFIGSYELDVLYRRDIDIAIVPKTFSKDAIQNLAVDFIKSNKFKYVGFSNIYDYPIKPYPKAFTFELWVKYGKQEWKIDLWYTQNTNFSVKKTQEFKAALTKKPKARLEILKFKQKYFDGAKYKNGLTGKDIYEKVLNDKTLVLNVKSR
jgi:hypothetical protein